MKALVFRKSIPRYLVMRYLGRRFRSLYTGKASLVSCLDVPEPKMPADDWVRIAPRLAGICGSDLATLCAKGSPYLAPMTSMPFVLGHELVGTITETGPAVSGLAVGDRVVVQPALGCRVRGIDPLCPACRDRTPALCRNVTGGVISAGIQTGYCRDTGGGFGERLVAHASQVYRVPEGLSDQAAVLAEPFACAIHGALRAGVTQEETVLIIGGGAIGLLCVAALRASGCGARIVMAAKHEHQRHLARRLGADELVPTGGSTDTRYRAWSQVLGAQVLRPELGKPAVIGGADAVLDCVASSSSLDDGIRFTRSGGRFVLVGMPAIPFGVDWTPMWFKELDVRAAYAYGVEQTANGPRDTFDLALEWLGGLQETLAEVVGPPYALGDHRRAFAAALRSGTTGVAKTLFAVESGRNP